MKSKVFDRARSFVYRNARPLDIARWQYHFEGGDKDAVLTALVEYQNGDGGFGHALEPDLWNPESTPFSTGVAIDILKEIDFCDFTHPIIQGIFSFLSSGVGYIEKGWLQKLASNNDYPHAPWWTYSEEKAGGFHTDFEYNPTAGLVGFCLRVAPHDMELWRMARRITDEALEKIMDRVAIESHELGCYCSLYEDLATAKLHDIFPLEELVGMLKSSVNDAIEKDRTKWDTYICKPSQFFNSCDSVFYADNRELAEYECEYIVKTQLEDGSWAVPWGWGDYPEEWAVSKNWWKGNGAIGNVLYLRGMGKA